MKPGKKIQKKLDRRMKATADIHQRLSKNSKIEPQKAYKMPGSRSGRKG